MSNWKKALALIESHFSQHSSPTHSSLTVDVPLSDNTIQTVKLQHIDSLEPDWIRISSDIGPISDYDLVSIIGYSRSFFYGGPTLSEDTKTLVFQTGLLLDNISEDSQMQLYHSIVGVGLAAKKLRSLRIS